MSSPPSSFAANNPKATDVQIRARLLNKLGIFDAPATVKNAQPLTAAQHRRLRILRGMGLGHTLHPSPPDGSASRNPLGDVKPFQEPLKIGGHHGDTPTIVPLTAASLSPDSRLAKKTTRIAFQEDVQVMPIPTRYEYSDRIAIEFASEGWNWRTVTEDDGKCFLSLFKTSTISFSYCVSCYLVVTFSLGMYICSQSGELVHPIHLQSFVEEESNSEDQSTQQQRQPLERGQPV
jgi:hypothetical protein